MRAALYEAIADQIANEDPPAVWATAQRLLAMGLDRRRVLQNLALTLSGQIYAGVGTDQTFDAATYAAALDRLPLPTADELEAVMVEIVKDKQAITIEEMEAEAMARLGLPMGEQPYESLLDRVSDRAWETDGPLALLSGDRVVHPESLCAGISLTHRLTEKEQTINCLWLVTDLVGFARRSEPLRTKLGEELLPVVLTDGNPAWRGPDGWLLRFPPGRLLAVRLDGDELTIDALDRDPPIDPSLVARLRAVYDAVVEEPWLPVSYESLLLGIRAADSELFAAPQVPLTELCAAAGLEVRGGCVAHDESVWDAQRKLHRMQRLVYRLDDDDLRVAMDILDAFDEQTEDPDGLRAAMAALRDPELLEVVVDEMLGLGDDPDRLAVAGSFAERLVAAASRPAEAAVAGWLAAVMAERRPEPLVAEAHIRRAAEADPDWPPAVDRRAWYLSDRGDAAGAVRLWRRLDGPGASHDLATVEPFAEPRGPKLGRNEPCWCGSGRKYKVCHLGRPEVAPLPERIGWLCRKASGYLERRGAEAAADVYELASIRAGGSADADALTVALRDPLVIDVALHELGWFDQFIAERGALLPDDEALLAASWDLVDRTVYEVVSSDPGVGVVVNDLRTAERIEVRERTFSRQAHPGMLVCGRAVPDGEGHQFIGGLLGVAPGTEAELLDLLDEGDAYELMEYVAALERPPRLVTREGQPLVACTATLNLPDADAARTVLDQRFGSDEPGVWHELHDLGGGDEVIRATLRLDGSRLTIETMSEERLDRVLSLLLEEIEGATLAGDDRRPIDTTMGTPRRAPEVEQDPAVRAALEEWITRQEIQWCDEPVPALAGLTPRQAAADPTRREALERLLVSFEARGRDALGEGMMAMRPERLRRHLGLEA